MISCRKLFLGFFNAILLAFAMFHAVFALMSNRGSSNIHCYRNPGPAIFGISAIFLIISLIGLIAMCCKSRSLETIHMWFMLITTIVVFTFTIFIFVTLPIQSANSTYQRTQNGNWLKAFSPFLRVALVNDKDWLDARTCLVRKDFCRLFNNSPPTLHLEYLRFLQKGCCSPPTRCGFLKRNETYWEIPKFGFDSQDGECQMWADVGDNGVCYDCDSCKAGYLAKFQMDWHADRGVFVTILFILIANTSLSFWTFGFRKENEQEK